MVQDMPSSAFDHLSRLTALGPLSIHYRDRVRRKCACTERWEHITVQLSYLVVGTLLAVSNVTEAEEWLRSTCIGLSAYPTGHPGFPNGFRRETFGVPKALPNSARSLALEMIPKLRSFMAKPCIFRTT